MDFYDIIVLLKASDVLTSIDAYRKIVYSLLKNAVINYTWEII